MFSTVPPFFPFTNPASTQDDASSLFSSVLPLINPLLSNNPISTETIDEQIEQLESVTQWLNVNLQMVNASIQQLQVQKQTMTALAEWQKLSADAMAQFTQKTPSEDSNTHTNTSTDNASPLNTSNLPPAFEQMAQTWWNGLQQQFTQLVKPIIEKETSSSKPSPKPSPTPSSKRKPAVKK